jgi:hypothetical protein
MQPEQDEATDAIAKLSIETDISRETISAVAILNRSEVEAQLDAARRYPRSIKTFMSECLSLATVTVAVAESCIYAVPRDGKTVTGPSVRLAEIALSAYRNSHAGARVIDVEEREVVSQGVTWDLEKNIRITIDVRRRIIGRSGKRYSDDMIVTTGNAATSIALRNSIFRVIPRAYIDPIFQRIRKVAVGDTQTLATRREELFARIQRMGIHPDRILARLGKPSAQDVLLEDLEVLIGLSTNIANGETSADEAFPAIRVSSLEAQIKAMPVQDSKQEPASKQERQRAQRERGPLEGPLAASAKTPPPAEACLICKKPVTSDGVETSDADGVVGVRHATCRPPREPGEEG